MKPSLFFAINALFTFRFHLIKLSPENMATTNEELGFTEEEMKRGSTLPPLS